jgi:hypothetical protein
MTWCWGVNAGCSGNSAKTPAETRRLASGGDLAVL